MPQPKYKFILLADYQFGQTIPATPYFIACNLAKKAECEVIFIEKSVSLLALLRDPLSRGKIRQFGKFNKISNNFFVYTPLPRLPFDRAISFFSFLNQMKLVFEMQFLFKKFLDKKTYLITYNYNSSFVVSFLKKTLKTIYWILDDWKEFDFPLGRKCLVAREDKATIESAELVITVSETLANQASYLNKNTHVIHNGVDIDQYRGVIDSEAVARLYQQVPPGPIIGFIGSIEQWIDLELIKLLATEFDEVNIVLVGPAYVNLDILSEHKNIFCLGPQNRESMPLFLSNMEIGIIPFKINNLSKSVSPLKLYEYLAAGLPVVSTPMDGVKENSDLDVYVEKNHFDFINRIRLIFDNLDAVSTRRKNRLNFANQNSWNARCEQFLEYLNTERDIPKGSNQ